MLDFHKKLWILTANLNAVILLDKRLLVRYFFITKNNRFTSLNFHKKMETACGGLLCLTVLVKDGGGGAERGLCM